MGNCYLYIFIYIVLLFGVKSNAQDEPMVSHRLDSVLTIVDEKLYYEEFEEVKSILDSLKKKKHYKNKFDRLAIEAREAQLLYENFRGEKAIKLLIDGMQELEKYPNSKLIWFYNYNYAFIYIKEKHYKNALKKFKICKENALIRRDTLALLKTYNQIGRTFLIEAVELDYRINKEYLHLADSSRFYINKVIASNWTNKPLSLTAEAYSLLSNIDIDFNTSLAKKQVQKAIELGEKIKDSTRISYSLHSLGNIFYIEKDYYNAIQAYQKGIKLLKKRRKKTASLAIKESSLQNISWAYNELGDYKNAYKYQELATELKDSLDILERSRNIAAIEAKYKEEQKTIEEKNKRLQSEVHFYSVAILSILLAILGYIIYRRLALKQKKTEQKITRLKYKALNAQMNPHFINNLLSTVKQSINNNDKQNGTQILEKFNKLTNLVLRSTKSNLIPLSEELTMLQLYLDLQLVRFNHKFNYYINTTSLVKKDIDHIKIPPLILQPVVENAITHGLSNTTQNGNITIDFNIIDKQYLKCIITDNGAQQKKDSIGNGISLKNINERLQLINQIQNNVELVNFQTIKNQKGETIGAKTTLNIPLIYG